MPKSKKPIHKKVRHAMAGKKAAIKKHYYRYMPDKKRHRVIAWAVFLSVSAIIAVQMLYPINRALPLARLAGQSVSFVREADLAAQIVAKFDDTRVMLVVDDEHKQEYSLKQLGAEPETQDMINELVDYPMWQRFIPLSLFWASDWLTSADVYFTDAILSEQSEEIASQFSFEPQNANLAIDSGQIIVQEAASGNKVSAASVHDMISGTTLKLGATTTIDLPTEEIRAARLTQDISPVYDQAEQMISHNIEIAVSDRIFNPSREEIATWLTISEDETGTLVLGIDSGKVGAYVAAINEAVAVEPGTSQVTIVNGRETGRTVAESGKSLDSEGLITQLIEGIYSQNLDISITAQVVDIPPKIVYNSKYSATEEGLRAYVNDIASSRNVRISLVQLDGGGWTASARATESIPAASTYKLFVALVLFDKMDRGEIRWEDAMLDTTVSGCFDRMTIASTNPCAVEWLNQFGRQYVNDFIYARGFSAGTTFTSSVANHTTAADLTKYMIGLYNGTLVSGANRDRLLHSLSVHPYKYGVQTGSQGKAYDKVGFLWDYIHDTAIVVHPRGTYVVTIMTKGYSYGYIAEITRQLERIMYP